MRTKDYKVDERVLVFGIHRGRVLAVLSDQRYKVKWVHHTEPQPLVGVFPEESLWQPQEWRT